MNLEEMRLEIGDAVKIETNPDPRVTARWDREINNAYRRILGMKGLSRLRRSVLTFTSTSGSPFVALPQAASLVLNIYDTVNRRNLYDWSLEDARFRDPGMAYSSAVPYAYVVMNHSSAIALPPTSAAELFVKSSSASDTGVDVFISGVRSNGYQKSVKVTLTGTTAISLDTTITNWADVTKFYLSSIAVGDVTLTMTSGAGTELARIPIGRTFARYTRLMLRDTPSAAVTYSADVELAVEPLVNEQDEPILPEDYHWLLPCGALLRELNSREKPVQLAEERARWRDGIPNLILFVQKMSGISKRAQGAVTSQLGPYYPAGS